jgi:putative glycosyltransferase (TIGR04348 family)
MRIGIVTPAPPGSRYGNRITALRWARILRRLGNRVSISRTYDGKPYDLLIALHARKSHSSIVNFQRRHAAAPIVVALTGTDLYRDICTNPLAQESLDIATRIVVLQPKAIEELRPSWRKKSAVIHQSVENGQALTNTSRALVQTKKGRPEERSNRSLDVCVVGHLRAVKDPFRAAMAARSLADSSKIRVLQVGGAMNKAMANRARREMSANKRYRWLGEQSRARVLQILKKSFLCVISSRMEGGANVLSEAIAASVPILASRIDGNVGILGPDYPGLFDVGNTKQLMRLLARAETDPKYFAELRGRCERLRPLFYPDREKHAWADLINELFLIK